MKPDDEVCLCFHVTKRKLVNYIRREQPKRATQLSDCLGAGSGCGWCRPFLRRLLESSEIEGPDAATYAQGRGSYIAAGKGTPPKN